MSFRPKVIYKYLPPDRLSSALPRDGTPSLRVTQPGAFNDPFESVPALKSAVRSKDMAGLAEELTRIAPDNPVDESTVEKLAAGIGVRLQQAHFLSQVNTRWGIVSLTTSYSNLLMWAHYGKDACGFVVGYDLEVLMSLVPDGHGTLEPVLYEHQRPVLDDITELTQGGPSLTKALLTKSSDWKYEDEWRMILPLDRVRGLGRSVPGRDSDFGLYVIDIPPQAIVEVYCTDLGHTAGIYDKLRDALGGHQYGTRSPKLLRRSLRTFDYELEPS